MDINDTSKAGIRLVDLLASAETGSPLDVRTEAASTEVADAGLAAIAAAIETASTHSGEEKSRPFLELLEDPESVRALGYAQRFRDTKLKAALIRVRRMKLVPEASALQGAANDAAKRQDAELQRRLTGADAGHRTSQFDRLLGELGVSGLRIPNGYDVGVGGVWRQTEPPERVSYGPLLLTGAAQDFRSGEIRVQVAWKRGKHWNEYVCERKTIADGRGIVQLANMGAPIHSGNARAVIDYLASFEAANLATMNEKTTSAHMGWQADGRTFVVGLDSFGGERDVELVAAGGLENLAAGYRAEGSFEGWCQVVTDLIAHRPLVMLAIYAAACTPLLRVLDQPGFVVDWSGETSMGKTSALRAAASVWGVPDDRGDGLILSWASSSMVGPMTVAHFQQSLPVILDDTKRGKPVVIGASLYDIPAGQERMKGTAEGGLRAIRRWRTCLLSTGEAPITSFSQAGGTRARTICLRGAPFGDPTAENRKDAESVASRLMLNHGHLGRRLVDSVTRSDKTARTRLRGRFEILREMYAEEATSAVAGRLAAYIALLHLTAEICERLGMPGHRYTDPIQLAWESAQAGADQGDPPTEALRAIYEWSVSHSEDFETRRQARGAPHGGWAGQWTTSHLALFPTLVDKLLNGWSYDSAGVVEAWHRRGWLKASGKRRTVRCTIDGERPRMIAFELGANGAPEPIDD